MQGCALTRSDLQKDKAMTIITKCKGDCDCIMEVTGEGRSVGKDQGFEIIEQPLKGAER